MAVKYKQSTLSDTYVRSDTNHAQIWKNSFEPILIQVKKTLDNLKKPATAAVLLGVLLFYDHKWALAASGGRCGGSAFSSSLSSKNSSSSSKGSSTSYSYSSTNYSYSGDTSELGQILINLAILLIVIFYIWFVIDHIQLQKTSILKLQVGLQGSARILQQDLNRLAETVDTSTRECLSFVLNEATMALLRHPDYCISCYSSIDVKSNREKGEKHFNQLSMEERGKFDEETLVNVNNIKIQSSRIQRASGLSNEYIVVTILVAVKRKVKQKMIKEIADLKEVLQKLGSMPINKIMAVEVLWPPQNEKDVLSERELLEDYPLLKPF